MKVAIFTETYFPFVSGVVTHIQTLKLGLEKQGHSVLIVTLDPKAKKRYLKDGVLYCPAVPLKKIYGYGVAAPINLRRLNVVRKFNPDVIHLHTEFSMGVFAQFCARVLKKPMVYTLHTLYDDYMFYLLPNYTPEPVKNMAKPLAHTYIRRLSQSATEVIGPSNKVVDYLRHCGVERRVHVVPNTADLSSFFAENVSAKDSFAMRKKWGMRESDVCLAFVGRLGKEKSVDILIEYFVKGFKDKPNVRLFIAGDGPDKKILQRKIKDYGVEGQVTLVGRLEHENVPAFYRACDLFASASLTEMHSISMLEAMAAGLYVLQRRDELNLDQIEQGVNGDVFESAEEFQALVESYQKLSKKEKEKQKKRVSLVTRRYGPAELADSVCSVYYQAMKNHAKSLGVSEALLQRVKTEVESESVPERDASEDDKI